MGQLDLLPTIALPRVMCAAPHGVGCIKGLGLPGGGLGQQVPWVQAVPAPISGCSARGWHGQHWTGLIMLILLTPVAALLSLCTPMYVMVSDGTGWYVLRILHISVSDGVGSGAVGQGSSSCPVTGCIRMGIPWC